MAKISRADKAKDTVYLTRTYYDTELFIVSSD